MAISPFNSSAFESVDQVTFAPESGKLKSGISTSLSIRFVKYRLCAIWENNCESIIYKNTNLVLVDVYPNLFSFRESKRDTSGTLLKNF